MEFETLQEAAAQCRRLEERLRVLSEATRLFAESTTDTQRLLDSVARRVAEIVKDYCVVLLLSDDGKTLIPAAAFDSDPHALREMHDTLSEPFHLDAHSVTQRVIETGEPFMAARLERQPPKPRETTARFFDFVQRMGIHSVLLVPLRVHDRSIGLLTLARFRKDSPPFDEHDLVLAQSLADHAALAIGNARLYAAERAARAEAEKATHALVKAETRFARLRDSGLIGILVSDLDGHVLEVNDAVLTLVGYPREDILSGRVPWKSLSPPEWRQADAKAIDELATSGIGRLREKEYIHRDGTHVPVLVGSAMLDGQAHEVVSFVLDLTERKRALAAVERMRAEHAAEAHLAAIVGASADAIIGKTLEGVVTSWNDGAEAVFGYSATEMVGRSISVLFPPGHAVEEAAILAAVARGEVLHFDAVRRRKDGRDIDVSVTSAPVRDAARQVVGISKVARDITDRRRAEAALAAAKDAAEASSRELEAFSYSVAHDLRAPLRGMNGFAHVLLEDYGDKLDADGRAAIDEICTNARKMGGLIDGLLFLSRVALTDWRPERVDLSGLARAVVKELSAADPGRQVDVVIEDDLTADMDPSLARALFENLLGNAWKFTNRTPQARIELGVCDRDGARCLFVRDNGAGFDMAYAKNLFAPFQRLHTVAEFPGTGIGLATVQRIVRRHGGKISAEGHVGAGAAFFFTLPGSSREAS